MSSFFKELRDGSERACALVGCAFLDHCLKSLLENQFITLTRAENKQLFAAKGAPLADMAAKVDLSYAMGFFTKTHRDDLHRIRIIRNAFGHAPRNVGFSMTAAIAEECSELSINTDPENPVGDPRMRFIIGTLELAAMLKVAKDYPPVGKITTVGNALVGSGFTSALLKKTSGPLP